MLGDGLRMYLIRDTKVSREAATGGYEHEVRRQEGGQAVRR
jgi:hypothetical protein